MTDNETMKTASENTCDKIKAIYPHITVTGDVDNPYYNIEWYDIEKQTMYRGYSSYKLPLVRKWLQENFEVVEADIDDLINRQKAEIEALMAGQEPLQKYRDDEINRLEIELKAMHGAANSYKAEIESITEKFNCQQTVYGDLSKIIKEQAAEITRLEETKNRLSYNLQAVLDERADHSEAVKEFAERFLKKVHDNHYMLSDQINSKDYGMFTIGIEQAVNETKKETVGES